MRDSAKAQLLARYDREVRGRPAVPPGMACDQRDGVVALVGYFNFVCSWSFSADRMDECVSAWAQRFRQRGEPLVWAVCSHDQPRELAVSLARFGFVQDEVATLMVMEAREACDRIPLDRSLDIRRVRDRDGLSDYLDAAEAAFGEPDTWQTAAFSGRLADPDLGLYTVYVDGGPVAAGRIEMDTHGTFAELLGGGVAPQHRGNGCYRGLVAVRARAAAQRNISYLTTSARDSSRPILEHLGFSPLGTRTLWVLRP